MDMTTAKKSQFVNDKGIDIPSGEAISNYMLHVDATKSNAIQSGHASTSKLLPDSSYKNEQTNPSHLSMKAVKNDAKVSHFIAQPHCEGYLLFHPGNKGLTNANPDYIHFPLWSVMNPPVKPTDECSKIYDVDDETWNNFAQEITLQLKIYHGIGCTFNLLYIGCIIFVSMGELTFFLIFLLVFLVGIVYHCRISNNIEKVIDKYQHKFGEKGVDVKLENYHLVFSALPHPLVLSVV